MKKLFTLISLLSAFGYTAIAQYHSVRYINAGHNPGSKNTDIEEPNGANPGWTLIQAPSGSPVWSPVTAVPIPFNFNGSPVSSFKVSTSGVLTFTTSASAVPSSTSAALPSSSIPDNSVCVWGLSATGGNDAILTKTFGTTPNRQFWIQFNSYSYPGINPASGWSYWGIVLEEKTNNIYIVDQRTFNDGSAVPALALGVQINGTLAFSIAGSPNVTSFTNGGNIDDESDNSYYQFIPGVFPANDIELTSISIPSFTLAPSNVSVAGMITNYGTSPITSFTVKYQSGANVYTYNQTGVNITTGNTYNFTHGTPFNVAASIKYPLKAWVELAGDLNQSNDTLTADVTGLTFLPVKNIVFEEVTGTWCGFCPYGMVDMDTLSVMHPDHAMVISIHDYDPMTLSSYDAAIVPYISGYPSGCIDRKIVQQSPDAFFDLYNEHINDIMPCDVSVTASYDPSLKKLTINAGAHFATDLSGDYRLNAVVTEDSVHGTLGSNGSGYNYDQNNYFSSAAPGGSAGYLTGAGHNWYTDPDPVPAATMFYNHVARAILGGFSGLAGSLPSTITGGNTYVHTFTYTVPAGYNISQLKVIAWVCNGTTGEIYNAARANSVVGIKEESENRHHLLIYPNPSSGIVNIRSTVSGPSLMKLNVMNSIGETIMTFDKLEIHNANQLIDLSSFSNGLYFLQFIDENNATYINKILINR